MGPHNRQTEREHNFGTKRANQCQNNRKGPCEDAGGNEYKKNLYPQ